MPDILPAEERAGFHETGLTGGRDGWVLSISDHCRMGEGEEREGVGREGGRQNERTNERTNERIILLTRVIK